MKKRNINTTNETKSADLMVDLLDLFKQKLIKNIEADRDVIISICSPEVKCLDSIQIYDYEVTADEIYLTGDDLELHIGIKKNTVAKYYEEAEEYFSFVTNEVEINLYFS